MGEVIKLNRQPPDVVGGLTGGRGTGAASLGIDSEDLRIPLAAFAASLGDHRIVTALCPGGKERMRRLMNSVASVRVDLGALVTHRLRLDDIGTACENFAHRRDGVLRVAITPQVNERHRSPRPASAPAR